MPELKFKLGDTVRLKSGGPVMTVNGYVEAQKLQCAWFVETENKYGLFAPDALTAAELEPSQ